MEFFIECLTKPEVVQELNNPEGVSWDKISAILESENKYKPIFEEIKANLLNSSINDHLNMAKKIDTYLSENKTTLIITELSKEQITHAYKSIKDLNGPFKISLSAPIQGPVGRLWKLKNANNQKAYLLGTIHLVPDYLIGFNDKIRKSYLKSEAVAFEISTSKQETKETYKKENKASEEEIPQDFYSRRFKQEDIEKVYQSLLKLYPDLSQNMQTQNLTQSSWLYSALKRFERERWDLKSYGYHKGIEDTLEAQAILREMPIEELELKEHWGMDRDIKTNNYEDSLYNFKIFLSFLKHSPEKENIVLTMNSAMEQERKSTVDSIKKNIISPWEKGEEKNIGKTPDRQMLNRNLKMANRIEKLMKTGKIFFFTAGNAHMEGKKSILEILKTRGFRIERVLL